MFEESIVTDKSYSTDNSVTSSNGIQLGMYKSTRDIN